MWGKRKVVEDVDNTQTFQIAGASRDMPVFNLEVRVYNDGVAFRVIPLRGSIRNESPVYYEHTDFRFAGDEAVCEISTGNSITMGRKTAVRLKKA